MDYVLNKIKEISLKYKTITRVVLFGSRARGDNRETSDYDIAVFCPSMEDYEKAEFIREIEGVKTLNKIDVVFITERHFGTELYDNIQREGMIIVDKFQIKFTNYVKALSRLEEAIEEANATNSKTVRDGVIQRFEFTTELAWKTLREYLINEGFTDLNSPKAVMSEAFNNKLINDDRGWIQILTDRNSTSHIYDEDDAEEIYHRIKHGHIKLFTQLKEVLIKYNI